MGFRKSLLLITSTILWLTIILWTISEVTDYYGTSTKYHNHGRVAFVVLFTVFFLMYAAVASNYLDRVDYISWYEQENPFQYLHDIVKNNPTLTLEVHSLQPIYRDNDTSTWQKIAEGTILYQRCEDSSTPLPEFKGQFVELTLCVTLELSSELEASIQQKKKELEEKYKYEPGVNAKLFFFLPRLLESGTTIEKKSGFVNGKKPFYFNKKVRHFLFFVGLGIFLDLYIESLIEEWKHEVTKKLS
mmetsp:Transcript_14955/g.20905  ORF Transcript_14955/g.20905 Transcript_14955/m.20905 type:complete len:245 (-) Transcript_14955:20-754(-)